MKAKTIFIALALFLLPFFIPYTAFAQDGDAGQSATFHSLLVAREQDNRAAMLKAYLEKENSPLADYADTFVAQSDLYSLDWRFVAAIAGKESSFGKAEPCINPFGFGIYTGTTTCFASYDEAIKTVSKALRQQYIDKWGLTTVAAIGHTYAASTTWASGVTYFMQDMQVFADSQPQPIPISL